MSEQEKNKDQYIKSLMAEGGIENPSKQFTSNIIDTIKAQSSSSLQYKPVISRNAWLVIAFLGILTFLFVLFFDPSGGQGLEVYGYSLNFDFSPLRNILSKVAISFELSPIFKTSIIALFIFTFSNLIIFELKNRSLLK